jgi:hypothetical protein
MNIEIKITKTLSESVRKRIFGWSDDIFGMAGTEFANLPGKSSDLQFVLYQDG